MWSVLLWWHRRTWRQPASVHSYEKPRRAQSWWAEDKKKQPKRLTVRTSVGLQPEPDPPAGVPVQRNEAEEASDGRLLQLVLNHAVGITVTWKRLKTHGHMHRWFLKAGFHPNTDRILENTANSATVMQFSCVQTQFLQFFFSSFCYSRYLNQFILLWYSSGLTMNVFCQNVQFKDWTDGSASVLRLRAWWIALFISRHLSHLAIYPNYVPPLKLTRRLTGSPTAEWKLRHIINVLIPL